MEIAGAVVLSGGYDAGTSQALETSNPQVKSTPLTLFQGDGRLRPAAGVEARLGVYLAPRVVGRRRRAGHEADVARSASATTSRSAPDTVAEEQLTQYVIDGTLLYHFATFSSGHAGLFVAGGGGYLRQLDDGNENVTDWQPDSRRRRLALLVRLGRAAARASVGGRGLPSETAASISR